MLKGAADSARSRLDYHISKANREPGPHSKEDTDRASSAVTEISDAYVKAFRLAREDSGDVEKVRAVCAKTRKDLGRLLTSMGPVLPIESTQSSELPNTSRALTKSLSSGQGKLPVTDYQGFTPAPWSKSAYTARSTNNELLKKHRPSKNPFSLLPDDGHGLSDPTGPEEEATNHNSPPLRSSKADSMENRTVSKDPLKLLHDDGNRLPEFTGRKEESMYRRLPPLGLARAYFNAGQQGKNTGSGRRHLDLTGHTSETRGRSLASKTVVPESPRMSKPPTPPLDPSASSSTMNPTRSMAQVASSATPKKRSASDAYLAMDIGPCALELAPPKKRSARDEYFMSIPRASQHTPPPARITESKVP